ncbi:MAG: hypothetical protein AAGB19_16970 [Cyanobacteria bacterium P01_F01_bin.3]
MSVTDKSTNARITELPAADRILNGMHMVWSLLQDVSDRLDRLESAQRLGFGSSPITRTINCKRRDDCPSWYFWNGAEHGAEPIPHSAVTGYVLDLSVRQGEYKNKPTYNLRLLLGCSDRLFILDAGYESQFSRALMAALSVTPAHDLKQPITISARPGDDERVLLCYVWIDGQQVRYELPEEPDWNSIFSTASTNVKRANQN